MECTLCNSTNLTEFTANSNKTYFKCNTCNLFFIHPKHQLKEKEEFSRYSFHQNFITDKSYVKFLEQIIIPTLKYIKPDQIGLDFGCGPNPVLSQLLEEKNIKCDFYDPYFFDNLKKDKIYDFIFATECFEHFFYPGKEIKFISELLTKNGILAIMTEFYKDDNPFKDWYYIKDPTHVSFYNLSVFEYICEEFNLKKIYTDNKRVIILQKL